MRRCPLALALLAALLLGSGQARAAAVPSFAAGPCPFRVPEGVRIECGFLTVPEDRALPGGAQVRIAVAIARTARRPRLDDPVVYLAGGPGSAALASTPALAEGWADFLAHRDLIVLDQRGTGFSEPSLACADEDADPGAAEAVSPSARAAAERSALLRCRERLARAGVRLAAYTTAENARDLRDLRAALGYRSWNLFGISYGTRLALAALREDPAGVRSVVLDSVYPPQANLFTSMPDSLDRSLRLLYRDCAQSRRCRSLTPDLRATLEQLVARLDAEPAEVAVRAPGGERVTVRLDGARIIEVVFRSLYRSALIPQLPRAIAAASAGDYRQVAELERQRQERAQGSSAAMYYAVQCAEDLATTDLRARQAAAARYPLLAGYYRGVQEFTPGSADVCRAWGAAAPGPLVAAPVVSDVPALLLAGEYDPITPPAWADAAAATLRRAEVYRAAGTGHAVITRGACPRRVVAAFLDKLTAAGAAACLAELGRPAFAGR